MMRSTSSFTHVDFTAQKLEKYQNSKTCFTTYEYKLFLILISFYCIFENCLLLLTFCLLLLPLWESVIVLRFVVRYFMPILVLQSS